MRFRGDARMSPLRNKIWMCPELLRSAINHLDAAPARRRRSRLQINSFSLSSSWQKFHFKKCRARQSSFDGDKQFLAVWLLLRLGRRKKKKRKKLEAELCSQILLLYLFLTSVNAKLQKYNKNVKFMWNTRTVFATPRVWIAWNLQPVLRVICRRKIYKTCVRMWRHCRRDMMSTVEIRK